MPGKRRNSPTSRGWRAIWPKYKSDLARSHHGLGALLSTTGRPAEAAAVYQAACDLYAQLPSEFANGTPQRSYRAETLVHLANLKTAAKDYAAARRLLDEADAHCRAALEADPRRRSYRRGFSGYLVARGLLGLGVGDHAAAAKVAQELADFAFDPANDRYNAACLTALCVPLALEEKRRDLARGYADQAMVHLREAVKHGFKDVTHMREDDLKPLRPRPDYQKLLADLDGPREPLLPPREIGK